MVGLMDQMSDDDMTLMILIGVMTVGLVAGGKLGTLLEAIMDMKVRMVGDLVVVRSGTKYLHEEVYTRKGDLLFEGTKQKVEDFLAGYLIGYQDD
jgi:hypothetical protein